MINWNVMIKGLLISLILTLILELAYAWLWGIRNRHDLVLAILVNIFTNPIVVFTVYYVRFRQFQVSYGLITLFLECFAVITEALLYRKFSRTVKHPWLFSLSANAFSYAAGDLLGNII